MSDEGVVNATGETVSTPPPSAPVGSEPASSLTPPASAATSAPAVKKYAYDEDRSNWVPSHVVRERTQALQQLQRDLEYERQRVAALSGVKPPTPPRNPEQDAIRQQFFDLFPEMKELMDKREALLKWSEADPGQLTAISESQNQAWTAHGAQVLDRLEAEVKSVFGGAALDPKAMRRISVAFIHEVESDPQMRGRYEAGDLGIIREFVSDYKAGLLDPFTRSTSAATAPVRAAAARLPRGGGSSAITPGPARTLKPADGEAYHKGAWDRFQKG